MKKFYFTIATLLLLASCTENQRAKSFGGTSTMNLPKGEKLVNVTWKGDEIWYLTRPMKSDESPETYTYREESSLGVIEGTVIIKESK
jgi:hypothetical protein